MKSNRIYSFVFIFVTLLTTGCGTFDALEDGRQVLQCAGDLLNGGVGSQLDLLLVNTTSYTLEFQGPGGIFRDCSGGTEFTRVHSGSSKTVGFSGSSVKSTDIVWVAKDATGAIIYSGTIDNYRLSFSTDGRRTEQVIRFYLRSNGSIGVDK